MRYLWAVVALLSGCALAGAAPASVAIVRNGKPLGRVVISAQAAPPLQDAAQVLISLVKQATGADLPLVKDDALDGAFAGVSVHVGRTAGLKADGLLPPGLDDDGFVFSASGDQVVILGPSDYGTEFGVYDFLERYVGVRWLLPGEHGTDVPRMKTIAIPEGKRVDAPVFMSRLFSGLWTPPQTEWARRNRMHGRIQFHHNLHNVIPPTKCGEAHPEFFPVHQGKRFVPLTDTDIGWQPCFSARGLAEEAISNIVRYLDENPQITSYSLGVNDSSGHCRCPDCLAKVPPEKNFLGLDDYSDLYYDWCNKVIEGVLKTRPNIWFGCLAYSEVASPPRHVKVHPRLVPYMTYDRMKWLHPEVAKAGHEATVAWHKVSPALGWYDYIYGSPYCLPRVWFHHSRTYLEFGRDNGVKAHYAEIYPNWGEGPKPYLFLKLWWNPKQDVDKLLNEWYARCVGPQAAPALAKYYAIWERFWTKDIFKSQWFTVGGQYLAFYSPTYLGDVKRADIAESRRLLDEVVGKCQTDDQRARARLLEQAFRYYEASALAYLAHTNLQTADVSTEAKALATLDLSAEALEMAQRRRRLALEVFPEDPVLVHPIGIANSELSGESWGGSGLWAVADWVARGDNSVRRRVQELAATAPPTVSSQAKMLLAIVEGAATNLLTNGSFETGTDGAAEGWGYWLKPDEPPDLPIGRMLRSQDVAHNGSFSLLCDGMMRGGPVQSVSYPGPGRYYALCWVHAPAGQKHTGTVDLHMGVVDDKGANLPSASSRVIPPAGRWTLLVVGQEIPAQVDGKAVGSLRPIPIVDGFQDGTKVYLDEMGLYRLP